MERVLAAFLAAAFSVAIVARSLDPSAFNYDVAWILYVAEQMLEGQTLYRDIIDPNLPMVFWLSTIAVAFARAIGAAPILAFNAMVLLIAGLTGALCLRILRRGWPQSSASYRFAVVASFAVLGVLYPGFDYGQQENLFFLLVAPYLFAAAASARGQASTDWTAYAVGALAGIGFAINPYFVLVWFAVEIWLHRQTPSGRSWLRRENRVVVAVGLTYAAAVLVFALDYLDVLEMALTVHSIDGLLGNPWRWANPATALLGFAAALSWIVRPTATDSELRSVWLVATFAFLAMAVLQGKDWSNHYHPASSGALLLVAIVALGLAERHEELANVFRPRAAALPLLAMLLLAGYAASSSGRASIAAWRPSSVQPSAVTKLARVVKERAWRKPIYVMSTSVAPSFPLVNLTDARWSSRFGCLWLLPGLYSDEERAERPFPYHRRGEMSELEGYLIDSVVSDLEAAPPVLLIVEQSQALHASAFEYLNYFRRDPRFAAMFRQYSELTTVGPYRVYQRRSANR